MKLKRISCLFDFRIQRQTSSAKLESVSHQVIIPSENVNYRRIIGGLSLQVRLLALLIYHLMWQNQEFRY